MGRVRGKVKGIQRVRCLIYPLASYVSFSRADMVGFKSLPIQIGQMNPAVNIIVTASMVVPLCPSS